MVQAKKPANKSKKKPIEQYAHKGKQRANNPPVGSRHVSDGQREREEDLRLRSASRSATGLGRQSRADFVRGADGLSSASMRFI
jgi:hypothetical protein